MSFKKPFLKIGFHTWFFVHFNFFCTPQQNLTHIITIIIYYLLYIYLFKFKKLFSTVVLLVLEMLFLSCVYYFVFCIWFMLFMFTVSLYHKQNIISLAFLVHIETNLTWVYFIFTQNVNFLIYLGSIYGWKRRNGTNCY